MTSAILVQFYRSVAYRHSNCRIAWPTKIAFLDCSDRHSLVAVPIVECAILQLWAVHSLESMDSPIDLAAVCDADKSTVAARRRQKKNETNKFITLDP